MVWVDSALLPSALISPEGMAGWPSAADGSPIFDRAAEDNKPLRYLYKMTPPPPLAGGNTPWRGGNPPGGNTPRRIPLPFGPPGSPIQSPWGWDGMGECPTAEGRGGSPRIKDPGEC